MLRVIIAPNKALRTKSQPVLESEYEFLEEFFDKMAETMYSNSGVGLAAIQCGLAKRILVADFDGGNYGNNLIKMVNPRILETSEESTVMTEGCLSVPTIWENIERPASVRVEYVDENLETIINTFHDDHAHIILHEIDHLDGITILDKISRLKRDIYKRKINKYRRKVERALRV